MTKAYVLITVEIGRADDIYDVLSSTEGVAEINVVAGTYDLVAVVTADDTREVGRIVMGEIQRIAGVMSTVTLIAIR